MNMPSLKRIEELFYIFLIPLIVFVIVTIVLYLLKGNELTKYWYITPSIVSLSTLLIFWEK